MAGATGAVVVRDNGKYMQWRDKCEGCGYVSSCIHQMSTPTLGSRVLCGLYRCERCNKTSEIVIYG